MKDENGDEIPLWVAVAMLVLFAAIGFMTGLAAVVGLVGGP